MWGENPVIGSPHCLREVVDLPLLVKLLDTREVLSVQVHPDDTAARTLCGAPHGKSEGWVVLRAEPGARIAYGLRRALDVETLSAHAMDGSIEADLAWIGVQAGDVIDVPPGTIHAIGAGLLLYEIQQPVDLTFRLYDWGRGRELHLDHALAVARRAPQRPSATAVVRGPGRTELLRSAAFVVEEFDLPTATRVEGPIALTTIEGEVKVDGEPLAVLESVVVVDGAELSGAGTVLGARLPD